MNLVIRICHRSLRSGGLHSKALCVASLIAIACASFAEEVYVPTELQEWEEWVLAKHPNIHCPVSDLDGSRLGCTWISELRVRLVPGKPSFVHFYIVGEANAASHLDLPHGDSRPVNVQVNGEPARIGVKDGIPRVLLARGSFEVYGHIIFEVVPLSISIPRNAGVVKLWLDEVSVAVPKVERGELWLQPQETTAAAQDTIRVDVFRHLVDDIPQTLETQIRLTVDGSDRIEELGSPIFDGFKAVGVSTYWPVQVTSDGRFLVQVSRGVSWVTVDSISDRVLDEFTPAESGPNWPRSEIWVFEPESQHRTVQVEGAAPIDPVLVESPFGSKPTYRVPIDSTLRLTNERRGDMNPKPPRLTIERDIWLSFDGSSAIAKDEIDADIYSETRLSADYELGSVEVDGSRRLVTYGDGAMQSEPGITVHPAESQIRAVSELPSRSDLAANGWRVDSDSLNINLHIPPGWRLLWTRGVDGVRHSWLSAWWNLWDIFICVLIIVVLYRVGGWPIAGIVAVAIVLSYQDHTASAIGWLLLGLLLLLDRYLTSSLGKRINGIAFWTLLVPIAVMSLYVAANNIRQAVYPQLDDIVFFGPATGGYGWTESSEPRTELMRRSALEEGSEAFGDIMFDRTLQSGVEDAYAEGPESTARARARRDDDSETEELIVSGNFIESLRVVDDVATQTGPGLPGWRWDLVRLHWAGPVTADQRFGLTFLPPPLTRIVYVLVAALHLVILLLLVAAKSSQNDLIPPWLRRLLPALLVSAVATSTQAAFPDAKLLDELEERLTAVPACVPGCASLERATLSMDNENELRIELSMPAGAAVAVPLPVSEPATALKGVTRQGTQQPLLQVNSESTFAELETGENRMMLQYDLTGLNDLLIEFPLEPAEIKHDLCCWSVTNNVDADTQSILLQRASDGAESLQLDQSDYAFQNRVVVRRELDLKREPMTRTTVRVTLDRNEVLSLEIPLLRGETVLDEQLAVVDNHVILVFQPDVKNQQITWRTTLQLDDTLTLEAPSHSLWSEVWYVRGSDFWRFDATGIAPSLPERNATMFKPRPGETLTLALSKPLATPGQTITVNNAWLTSTIGNRATTSSLGLQITASVVDDVTLSLPDNAQLEAVRLNGEERPLAQGTQVELPIAHGENDYRVFWRLAEPLGLLYETPTVSLTRESRNIRLLTFLPRDRWVLLLGGPAIGSAVLFWGIVLVTVIVALALTYLPRFPLSKLDAVLIAIGATLANIWALLFVALWIVGVWWRARTSLDGLSRFSYRAVHIALVALTVLGLFALFWTVFTALRVPPDMAIATPMLMNQSTFYSSGLAQMEQTLFWFADTSGEQLPTAWIFSLPFWTYQLAMLAWSLWLVFALTKWVRTTFRALTVPSFWRNANSVVHDEDSADLVEASEVEGGNEPQAPDATDETK